MSKNKHDNDKAAAENRRDQQAEPEQAQVDEQASAQQSPEKERDELQQRLLRVSADYRNYVRRSKADVATAQQQQLVSIARELITVLDHFDNALEADAEKTSTEALLKGVAMVRDELMRVLARFGIERIDVSAGEPFDPTRHEAMMRQPSEDVESNHVAAQLQPGYALEDKTIRPAKVAVAE